ncbi:MAG: autotransporter-associated beta strand repeat-containing protein, partial [Verrucomicrobiota bacterium]|nr:autotransporter-associated beta strand repeat-containing protein [Verrucomicrobiota bacterium]
MATWLPGPHALNAATLLWDSDGATGGVTGGPGTWDQTTTNLWDLSGTMSPWVNANNDIAVLGGTVGTITLGEAITAGALQFNTTTTGTGSYTIGGASNLTIQGTGYSSLFPSPLGITVASSAGSTRMLSPTIAANVILGSSQNWSIGYLGRLIQTGVLSDGGIGYGINKTGSGTLELTNASNSYTGSTAVRNGVLVIRNTGALGTGTSTVMVSGEQRIGGGTLMLASGSMTGFNFTRDSYLAGIGVGLSPTTQATNQTFISPQGALMSVGNNTVSGNITTSSFTATRITSGFGTLNITGGLTLGAGQDLQLTGGAFASLPANIVISGQINPNGATTGGIIKIGTGTAILTNTANNINGRIRIDNGTLRISDGRQLGSLYTASDAIRFNNSILEVRADPGVGGISISSFNTRNVSLADNNGTILVDRAVGGSGLNQTIQFGAFTFGNISRTLTLNGRDGYGFTIGSVGANLGGNGNNNVAITTGTINGLTTINGNITIGDGTAGRNMTFTTAGDAVWNGSVLTAGTLPTFTKAGSGTLTMTGTATTITGDKTVSAGTLAVNGFGAFNLTPYTGRVVMTGGTLNYRGAAGTGAGETVNTKNLLMNAPNSIVLANQTGTSPSALVIASNIGANTTAAKTLFIGGASTLDNTISGVITNNTLGTGLTKIGTGTWQINSSNTATNGINNAAFAITAIGATATTTVTATSTAGLVIGQPISGTGFAAGTVITDILSPTQFTISANASNTGSTASVAPVSGATAALTVTANTANLLTVASTAGLVPGQPISGTGMPASAGWFISQINGATTFTVANSTSAAALANSAAIGAQTPLASVNFGGNLTVAGGTLKINPTSAAGNVINNGSSLIFNVDPITGNGTAGGTFNYLGFSTGSTEALGQLVPTAGAGTIQVTPGSSGTTTLSFASLGARGAGATLNFKPGTGTGIQFGVAPSGTAISNGIIGGYAYITTPGTNAIDFLAVPTANTNVAALGASTALPATVGSATTNYVNNSNLTTTGAVAANSLRIVGSGQAITLGAALTITSASAAQLGGILFDNSAGSATLSGSSITTSAANQELVLIAGGNSSTNALTIGSVLANGSGQVTKAGGGVLILSGANTFTGALNINEGTLRASGSAATILGTSAAGTVSVIRQGATLDLNAAGVSGPAFAGATPNIPILVSATLNGAGSITTSAAGAQAIQLGVATSSGSGVFSGVISDGSGVVSVIRNGASGNQALTGLNTYTGATILSGAATLQVVNLANGGTQSSIGASSNAAGNLVFNGGVLQYTGSTANGIFQATQTPTVAIDRLFTMAGSGSILSSGTFGNNVVTTAGAANSAALVFNNSSGAIAFSGTVGLRTLTLGGNSTGDNEMGIRLVETGGYTFGITKANDASLWILSNSANNYSGATTILGSAGALMAQDAVVKAATTTGAVTAGTTFTVNSTAGLVDGQTVYGAGITGNPTITVVDATTFTVSSAQTVASGTALGFGAATGALPGQSNLTLNGGVFQTTASSFVRGIGTGAGAVSWAANGSGGFAAGGNSKLTVNLGGQATPDTVLFGTGGIGNGTGTLILSSATALSEVDVINNINLGVSQAATRTVQVDDNGTTNTDYATMSGVISNSGTTAAGIAAFRKTGGGVLVLTGNNTFTGGGNATAGSGGVRIQNGVLVVNNMGANGQLGALSGAADIVNRLVIGEDTTTGRLDYVGSGETVVRRIEIGGGAGTSGIQNNGSGALVLTDLTFTNTGARILDLRGLNADRNEVSAIIANNGANTVNVAKNDGGTWVLTGNNTFTGGSSISGGVLVLGHDNALGTGTITGGNAAIQAIGGTRTISNAVTISNANLVVSGTNSFVFQTGLFANTGGNSGLNNFLSGGAALTINSAISLTLDGTARTFIMRGTGTTILNGVIGNGATAVSALQVEMSSNTGMNSAGGLVRIGGTANTFTGNTNLNTGILQLDAAAGPYTAAATPLGANTNQLAFVGNSYFQTQNALTMAQGITLSGNGLTG